MLIEADDKAVEALAQYVRDQGKAFSMFDAARLVLAGPDRHQLRYECEPERLVGFYQMAEANCLYETRDEALRYVLRMPELLAGYYQQEEVELEEPKGNFSSVGVCGMSGEILGPPSHHSYQTSLKRLHQERYSDLAFEDYKRRVQVQSDPEKVAKWKEDQRKGMKWTWLKGEVIEGQAPASFTSQAEMEAHFRRTHGEDVAAEVRTAIIKGTVRREMLSPGLGRLFRQTLEETRKHLFDFSQRLAHALERKGLKLFKRRSGKLFVSKTKPRAIDPGVIFSERVAAIVEAVREAPGIPVLQLLETLAPSEPAAEGADPSEPKLPTEEQRKVIRDIRWLADEGYLIEYSDGPLFLGIQGDPPNAKPTPAAPTAESPSPVPPTSEPAPTEEPSAEEIPAPEESEPEPAPTEEPSAEEVPAMEGTELVVTEAAAASTEPESTAVALVESNVEAAPLESTGEPIPFAEVTPAEAERMA